MKPDSTQLNSTQLNSTQLNSTSAATAESRPKRDARRYPKIVVVDDDVAVAELLTRFLTKSNYAVTTFTNPQKVLEYLKTNSVDLMITDLQMPEMSGIELIKTAKGIKSNLPIIVITGTPDAPVAAEIPKLDIAGYFQKPFNLNYLAGQITQILNPLEAK